MKKKILFFTFFIGLFIYFLLRISIFRLTKNFEVVDPNKVFRSAQLTEGEIKELIEKYQLKTVLSLRGPTDKTFWYEDQTISLKQMGLNYVYLGMSDDFYPDEKQVRQILEVLKNGPFPLLIHCRSGADRTGLVSALYKKYFMLSSNDEIQEQLSFKYWHLKYFKPAMDAFLQKSKSLDWLKTEYQICDSEFDDFRSSNIKCP